MNCNFYTLFYNRVNIKNIYIYVQNSLHPFSTRASLSIVRNAKTKIKCLCNNFAQATNQNAHDPQ